jgi:hypothetical protein
MDTIIAKCTFEQSWEFRVSRSFDEERSETTVCSKHALPQREAARAAREMRFRCLVSVATELSSFGPSPTAGKEIAHYVS